MHILDQVRNLPDTEFKIYAVLTGLFILEPGRKGKISARDLAEAANVSRRSVQYAMDNLQTRNLIQVAPGKGPKAPTIALIFVPPEKISGAEFAPLAEATVAEIHRWRAQNLRQYGATGANFAPVEDLFPQATGADSTPVDAASGANFAPLAPEGQGDAGARVDSIRFKTSIIDRVLTAKARDFDARELREASRLVHGYQCKYARHDQNKTPPDEKILAQILTAAGSLAALNNLIFELMAAPGGGEEPGHQYAWYVTVALQRIHGIAPGEQKEVRAQLKLARKPSPPAITGTQQPLIAEQQPAPTVDPADGSPLRGSQQFSRDLIAEVQQKRKGANR